MTKEKVKEVENKELDDVSGGLKPIDCPSFHHGNFHIDEDDDCPMKVRNYDCCPRCNRHRR